MPIIHQVMGGTGGAGCVTPPPPVPPVPTMVQYASPNTIVTPHPPVYGKPYLRASSVSTMMDTSFTPPGSTSHPPHHYPQHLQQQQSRELMHKRYIAAAVNSGSCNPSCNPSNILPPTSPSIGGNNSPSTAALLGPSYSYLQSKWHSMFGTPISGTTFAVLPTVAVHDWHSF